MTRLGERLREARERQGVSLAQAAAETRILQRYLIALENGEYAHLPGDVYARGFLRNYARYLDIPSDELIELYRQERGATEPIRVAPVTDAPRVRNMVLPSFFGVFFIVMLLVGVGYLALSATNRVGESAQPTAIPTSAPTIPPLATAIPPTSLPVAAQPTSIVVTPINTQTSAATLGPAGSVPTPTTSAPIVGEVRVQTNAASGSWMRIQVDGRSIFEGIVAPGDSRQFSAQRRLEILIGNAGVVGIVVNGREFQNLGGSGQVVTFNWPPA